MSDNDTNQFEENEEDIFNILVATDIHLGYEESHPIRCNDSFDTFEEILQIAVKNEVDFILLGGDLFHYARPSPFALNKCLELLRKYCIGNKPISLEYLSDPIRNLKNTQTVNYEDPNLNVSIPVFSIHGNHDDPTGYRHVSVMDVLSSSSLINYFGRWENFDFIEVEPILMKKGESRLALYGLSHIKDERLGRLFLEKKFKMMVPGDQDAWFHLLVWHQNRATRGAKNFIPDNTLPEFLDLVVWGHEHDCRIKPEPTFNGVWISQPGSSVATSLSAGEAITKHVGLLKIYKKNFKMEPIELRTVRPFVYEDYVMKSVEEMKEINPKDLPISDLSEELIKGTISEMLEKAKNLGRVGRASELPLIRLMVKCRDESQVISNAIRFGQAYCGIVANPDGMVKCNVIKDPVRRRNKDAEKEDIKEQLVVAARVEDMVTRYFEENDTLTYFSVKALNEGVKQFVDLSNTEAISVVVEKMHTDCLKYLIEQDDDNLEECLNNFKLTKATEDVKDIKMIFDQESCGKVTDLTDDPVVIDDDDDDDEAVTIEDDDDDIPGTSKRVSKRGRGGASKATRGTTRGTRGSTKGTRGSARKPRGARGKAINSYFLN